MGETGRCALQDADGFWVASACSPWGAYDNNEAHRLLAEDIEDYLGPIYRTEARFVICLLGPDSPKRVWTKFESAQFRDRFGRGAVVPAWFTTAEPGMFDESSRVGGYTFDPHRDIDAQLEELTEMLTKKMAVPKGNGGDPQATAGS